MLPKQHYAFHFKGTEECTLNATETAVCDSIENLFMLQTLILLHYTRVTYFGSGYKASTWTHNESLVLYLFGNHMVEYRRTDHTYPSKEINEKPLKKL